MDLDSLFNIDRSYHADRTKPDTVDETGNRKAGRGLLEVVPVPRFPIERIRLVATVMDRVSQGVEAGGCAHEVQGGSASVLIAGGRAA